MTPTADQPSAWQRDRVVPAALALITLVGLVLRLHLYERSLVGDELSTLWIVQNHGLLDTIRLVGTNAEITPPFSFVLSWFSTRLGDAPELVRLPSLIAGVATIPLVYLLGRRTVSIRAGLVGSSVFALSPFVTYFAANGRGYAVLILLLIGSTLTMLRGVESGRAGWWVAYGLLSCLAMYTHYTAAFVLVAQLGWVLVQHPPARLVALAANALAALLYLPWVPKVLDDFDSPTTDIMEALQGSGLGAKRNAFEQWVFGHQLLEPASFPGAAVMIVIGLGLLVAIGGLIFRFASRGRDEAMPAPREGLALIVVIALAAPVMEALLLLTGTDLLGSRNMAPSWYGLAATIGALVTLPGGAVTLVSGALVLGGYGAGAVKLWGQDGNVIAVKEVAEKIDAEARPGDS
ncbi:MAG: glycosyltransferase family 39 protein, partial [Solirubrobacterales bacterium]|nr:glycosyltransferase family 39 protein [Solirubrobacterales bacterium]